MASQWRETSFLSTSGLEWRPSIDFALENVRDLEFDLDPGKRDLEDDASASDSSSEGSVEECQVTVLEANRCGYEDAEDGSIAALTSIEENLYAMQRETRALKEILVHPPAGGGRRYPGADDDEGGGGIVKEEWQEEIFVAEEKTDDGAVYRMGITSTTNQVMYHEEFVEEVVTRTNFPQEHDSQGSPPQEHPIDRDFTPEDHVNVDEESADPTPEPSSSQTSHEDLGCGRISRTSYRRMIEAMNDTTESEDKFSELSEDAGHRHTEDSIPSSIFEDSDTNIPISRIDRVASSSEELVALAEEIERDSSSAEIEVSCMPTDIELAIPRETEHDDMAAREGEFEASDMEGYEETIIKPYLETSLDGISWQALPRLQEFENLPLKKTELDILPPEDPSNEFVLLKELEDKVLPPEELEVEVLPPKDLKAEVLPPKELESEVLPPKEFEGEVLPSKKLEGEVLPPKELKGEVLPPKELKDEVLPPKEVEVEVLPPKELESEVLPPMELEDEVLPMELEGEVLQPKELEVEILPPKELESEVVPPMELEGEDLPMAELGGELLQPKELEGEVLLPKELKSEVLPPMELEGEVLPPKELEGEVLPAKELKDEVLPPKELEGEVLPSKELEGEVLPSKELKGEVLPPKELEGEVLPPKEFKGEVLPPKELEGEVLPLSEREVEVLPLKKPKIDVISPEELKVDILRSKELEVDVLPPKKSVVTQRPPEEPRDEVLPPREVMAGILPPHEPEVDDLTGKRPGADVLPPLQPMVDILPPKEVKAEAFSRKEPAIEALPPKEPGDDVLQPREPQVQISPRTALDVGKRSPSERATLRPKSRPRIGSIKRPSCPPPPPPPSAQRPFRTISAPLPDTRDSDPQSWVSSQTRVSSPQTRVSSQSTVPSLQSSVSFSQITITPQSTMSSFQSTRTPQSTMSSFQSTITPPSMMSSSQSTRTPQSTMSSFQSTITSQNTMSSFQSTMTSPQSTVTAPWSTVSSCGMRASHLSTPPRATRTGLSSSQNQDPTTDQDLATPLEATVSSASEPLCPSSVLEYNSRTTVSQPPLRSVATRPRSAVLEPAPGSVLMVPSARSRSQASESTCYSSLQGSRSTSPESESSSNSQYESARSSPGFESVSECPSSSQDCESVASSEEYELPSSPAELDYPRVSPAQEPSRSPADESLSASEALDSTLTSPVQESSGYRTSESPSSLPEMDYPFREPVLGLLSSSAVPRARGVAPWPPVVQEVPVVLRQEPLSDGGDPGRQAWRRVSQICDELEKMKMPEVPPAPPRHPPPAQLSEAPPYFMEASSVQRALLDTSSAQHSGLSSGYPQETSPVSPGKKSTQIPNVPPEASTHFPEASAHLLEASLTKLLEASASHLSTERQKMELREVPPPPPRRPSQVKVCSMQLLDSFSSQTGTSSVQYSSKSPPQSPEAPSALAAGGSATQLGGESPSHVLKASKEHLKSSASHLVAESALHPSGSPEHILHELETMEILEVPPPPPRCPPPLHHLTTSPTKHLEASPTQCPEMSSTLPSPSLIRGGSPTPETMENLEVPPPPPRRPPPTSSMETSPPAQLQGTSTELLEARPSPVLGGLPSLSLDGSPAKLMSKLEEMEIPEVPPPPPRRPPPTHTLRTSPTYFMKDSPPLLDSFPTQEPETSSPQLPDPNTSQLKLPQVLVPSLSASLPQVSDASPAHDKQASPTHITKASPTQAPKASPTQAPKASPSQAPKASPTQAPKASPSQTPKASPSQAPKASPTQTPKASPSQAPKASPTQTPKASPTKISNASPTLIPKPSPSQAPKASPSQAPKASPSQAPKASPSQAPKASPSQTSKSSSQAPKASPTQFPEPTQTQLPQDSPVQHSDVSSTQFIEAPPTHLPQTFPTKLLDKLDKLEIPEVPPPPPRQPPPTHRKTTTPQFLLEDSPTQIDSSPTRLQEASPTQVREASPPGLPSVSQTLLRKASPTKIPRASERAADASSTQLRKVSPPQLLETSPLQPQEAFSSLVDGSLPQLLDELKRMEIPQVPPPPPRHPPPTDVLDWEHRMEASPSQHLDISPARHPQASSTQLGEASPTSLSGASATQLNDSSEQFGEAPSPQISEVSSTQLPGASLPQLREACPTEPPEAFLPQAPEVSPVESPSHILKSSSTKLLGTSQKPPSVKLISTQTTGTLKSLSPDLLEGNIESAVISPAGETQGKKECVPKVITFDVVGKDEFSPPPYTPPPVPLDQSLLRTPASKFSVLELESVKAKKDLQQQFEGLPVASTASGVMIQSFDIITWKEEENKAPHHERDAALESKFPRTSTPQPHSVSLDAHMERQALKVPPLSHTDTSKRQQEEGDARSLPTKKRKLGIRVATEPQEKLDFDVQGTATQTSPLPTEMLKPPMAKVSSSQEVHVSSTDTSFEVRVMVSVKSPHPSASRSDDSSDIRVTAVPPGAAPPGLSLVPSSTEPSALHTRSESKPNKEGSRRRKKKTKRTKNEKNDSRPKKIKREECVVQDEPLCAQGEARQELESGKRGMMEFYVNSLASDTDTDSESSSPSSATSSTDDDDDDNDDSGGRSYQVTAPGEVVLATIEEDVEEDSGAESSGHWLFSADNTDTESVIHVPAAITQHPLCSATTLEEGESTGSEETVVVEDEEGSRAVGSKEAAERSNPQEVSVTPGNADDETPATTTTTTTTDYHYDSSASEDDHDTGGAERPAAGSCVRAATRRRRSGSSRGVGGGLPPAGRSGRRAMLSHTHAARIFEKHIDDVFDFESLESCESVSVGSEAGYPSRDPTSSPPPSVHQDTVVFNTSATCHPFTDTSTTVCCGSGDQPPTVDLLSTTIDVGEVHHESHECLTVSSGEGGSRQARTLSQQPGTTSLPHTSLHHSHHTDTTTTYHNTNSVPPPLNTTFTVSSGYQMEPGVCVEDVVPGLTSTLGGAGSTVDESDVTVSPAALGNVLVACTRTASSSCDDGCGAAGDDRRAVGQAGDDHGRLLAGTGHTRPHNVDLFGLPVRWTSAGDPEQPRFVPLQQFDDITHKSDTRSLTVSEPDDLWPEVGVGALADSRIETDTGPTEPQAVAPVKLLTEPHELEATSGPGASRDTGLAEPLAEDRGHHANDVMVEGVEGENEGGVCLGREGERVSASTLTFTAAAAGEANHHQPPTHNLLHGPARCHELSVTPHLHQHTCEAPAPGTGTRHDPADAMREELPQALQRGSTASDSLVTSSATCGQYPGSRPHHLTLPSEQPVDVCASRYGDPEHGVAGCRLHPSTNGLYHADLPSGDSDTDTDNTDGDYDEEDHFAAELSLRISGVEPGGRTHVKSFRSSDILHLIGIDGDGAGRGQAGGAPDDVSPLASQPGSSPEVPDSLRSSEGRSATRSVETLSEDSGLGDRDVRLTPSSPLASISEAGPRTAPPPAAPATARSRRQEVRQARIARALSCGDLRRYSDSDSEGEGGGMYGWPPRAGGGTVAPSAYTTDGARPPPRAFKSSYANYIQQQHRECDGYRDSRPLHPPPYPHRSHPLSGSDGSDEEVRSRYTGYRAPPASHLKPRRHRSFHEMPYVSHRQDPNGRSDSSASDAAQLWGDGSRAAVPQLGKRRPQPISVDLAEQFLTQEGLKSPIGKQTVKNGFGAVNAGRGDKSWRLQQQQQQLEKQQHPPALPGTVGGAREAGRNLLPNQQPGTEVSSNGVVVGGVLPGAAGSRGEPRLPASALTPELMVHPPWPPARAPPHPLHQYSSTTAQLPNECQPVHTGQSSSSPTHDPPSTTDLCAGSDPSGQCLPGDTQTSAEAAARVILEMADGPVRVRTKTYGSHGEVEVYLAKEDGGPPPPHPSPVLTPTGGVADHRSGSRGVTFSPSVKEVNWRESYYEAEVDDDDTGCDVKKVLVVTAESPTPQRVDISPTPPRVDVSPTPPRVDVSPTPPRVDVSPTPPRVDVSPTSPRVDVSPTPQRVDVSPTPQRVDVSPTPKLVAESPAPPAPMPGNSAIIRPDIANGKASDQPTGSSSSDLEQNEDKIPKPSTPIWQRFKLPKISSPKSPRPKLPPKPQSLSSRSSDTESSKPSSPTMDSGSSTPSSPDSKPKKTPSSPRFFSWGSKREKKVRDPPRPLVSPPPPPRPQVRAGQVGETSGGQAGVKGEPDPSVSSTALSREDSVAQDYNSLVSANNVVNNVPSDSSVDVVDEVVKSVSQDCRVEPAVGKILVRSVETEKSLSADSDASQESSRSPAVSVTSGDDSSDTTQLYTPRSAVSKPPLPPHLQRPTQQVFHKARLLSARRQYFSQERQVSAPERSSPPKDTADTRDATRDAPVTSTVKAPLATAAATTTRYNSIFDASKSLKERFERFSASARAERERLAKSTPDLSVIEASVRRPGPRIDSWSQREQEQQQQQQQCESHPTSPASASDGDAARPAHAHQGHSNTHQKPRAAIHERYKNRAQRIHARARTQSVGVLETDLDTGASREFLTLRETNLDDLYRDLQQLLDTLPAVCAAPTPPEKVRAKSLLDLEASGAAMEAQLAAPARPPDTRAKSMEFLLDDDNKAAVQPPENELMKGSERQLSEAELRVRRSLQRLDVPEWMKNAQPQQQGFLLRRRDYGSSNTSATGGGWSAYSSKTASMTSLGSSRAHTPNTPTKVVIPTRVATRGMTGLGGVVSPASNSSISPSPSDRSGSLFQYPISRWSTSRLNSGTTTPTGSVTSSKSTITYTRQPYLGWRSQTSLASLAGSQSSLTNTGSYLTAADRLALGITSYSQRFVKQPVNTQDKENSSAEANAATPKSDSEEQNNEGNTNGNIKLQVPTDVADVHSSIKEVTSAIVHYCNESTPSPRASPRGSPRPDGRAPSPRRLVWVESSFVGSRPITSPETPTSSSHAITPTSQLNGHDMPESGEATSRPPQPPGEYLLAW